MAVDFGATNDASRYYEFGDPTGTQLELPDGDWCVGMWLRLPNGLDTGNAHQYVLSAGSSLGGTDTFFLFFREDSDAVRGNLVLRYRGNSGSEFNEILAPAVAESPDYIVDTPHLLVIQSRSGNVETYWVPKDGTRTTPDSSHSDPTTGSVQPDTTWQFGRRTDGNTVRAYRNEGSELFFLLNDSLTAVEVTTLAAGNNITEVRATSEVNLRFLEADATVQDQANDWDATRNGAGITTVTHPFIVGGLVEPSPITSAEAFGSAVVLPGGVSVAPLPINSDESFTTPDVASGISVIPDPINTEEAFSPITIDTGAVGITPNAIDSGEAFDVATLSSGFIINAGELLSDEAFTEPTLNYDLLVLADPIDSDEAFFTLQVGDIIITDDVVYARRLRRL